MPSELVGPIGVALIFLVLVMGIPRNKNINESMNRCKDKANSAEKISCELGEKIKKR